MENLTTLGATKTIREGLLNRVELAREFNVSPRTVDRWRALRTGPPRIKLGKIVYYRREAVRAWLAQHEEKSPERRNRP